MSKALEAFVATVEATGGVFRDEEGLANPVADPEWCDLGEAYLRACEETGRKPIFGKDPR